MTDLPPDDFHTTRWSVVQRSRSGDEEEAKTALNQICTRYWIPIYGFIRRRTASNEEAEDLTQSYFAQLLGRDYLGNAAPEFGKLRAFLLTDLKLFLSNERDRATARKRRGPLPDLSIDYSEFPESLSDDLVNTDSPDQWFDRQWAMRVFQTTLNRLREDYVNRDKERLFDLIKPCLEGSDPGENKAIAEDLGITHNAVKQEVFRLRQRFRSVFRTLIADTVESEEEVDREIQYLTRSLRK